MSLFRLMVPADEGQGSECSGEGQHLVGNRGKSQGWQSCTCCSRQDHRTRRMRARAIHRSPCPTFDYQLLTDDVEKVDGWPAESYCPEQLVLEVLSMSLMLAFSGFMTVLQKMSCKTKGFRPSIFGLLSRPGISSVSLPLMLSLM